ncbi:prepilin peptidase [Candidatus Peregrinibacteria bacterium]|nr:prepilin peptidase [Candidatus Peregrinibacteria bacterium]
MILFTAALVFIFGSIIGSFLSVVTYRLDKEDRGMVFGRSICPNCKQKIKWRHLVPIFSWLFLRGKCANCGKNISFHYLALEVITGIIFAVIFLRWNFIDTIPINGINWEIFQQFFFYIIEFSFLVAIFFYDFLHKEIPDKLSLPAIVIAFAGGWIFNSPTIMNMLIGGGSIAAFFLLQFLLSKGAWIGGGDIRLGALIGILLGWELGLLATVIAYFSGAIISIPLLLQKKLTRKSTIPFGPFLIFGATISLFFGTKILEWYFSTLI